MGTCSKYKLLAFSIIIVFYHYDFRNGAACSFSGLAAMHTDTKLQINTTGTAKGILGPAWPPRSSSTCPMAGRR